MRKYTYILILILSTQLYSKSCIADLNNREIVRNEYTFPETIESEHFVIHYTTADVDSQEVFGVWYNLQSNHQYAQSIIDHLEETYVIYLSKGWIAIPPDCDESITDTTSSHHCRFFGGNNLYDVYIANDAAGMVVPETSYPIEPYTGGFTSYMKIATLLNEYETLPSWNFHVIAHELHHAIQLRYGYSVSGSAGNYIYNGWLFEQTATYMENVIYPNNIHLTTMLANCNVSTPLTFPEHNIDHSQDIYQYRSALWQKFLVESYNDSSVIRLIWEQYGEEYASGNAVSLFPIYNDAIKVVTNNEVMLSDAYRDYAIWRYYTGNRTIQGQHFLDSPAYCTSSVINLEEASISLSSEKGAARYIALGPNDLNININVSLDSLLILQHVTSNGDISDLNLENSSTIIQLDNLDNEAHALLITSKYTGNPSEEIFVNLTIIDAEGDLNQDGLINILDVIIVINLILSMEYNIYADLNEDGLVNILDVVIYTNIIIS